MHNGPALFQSRKAKDKPHHLVLIKGSYQHRAHFYQWTQGQGGEYFAILNTPDFFLQTLDLAHLGEFNNVPEDYRCWFITHCTVWRASISAYFSRCHGLVPWSFTLAATKVQFNFPDATALCRGVSRSLLRIVYC